MGDNEIIVNYIDKLKMVLSSVDSGVVMDAIRVLDVVHEAKGKVYIAGNGGSAATASHMANDLGVGIKLREIRNFEVESLSDNSSVCSAIANDIGYDNVFYAQIKNKITPSDVLIAISCSGNSANIVKAVKYAKNEGAKVIGLTGFDGGQLKSLSDVSFHIQTEKGEYGIVEDMHMIFDHMIYSYYVSLKPENKSKYTME